MQSKQPPLSRSVLQTEPGQASSAAFPPGKSIAVRPAPPLANILSPLPTAPLKGDPPLPPFGIEPPPLPDRFVKSLRVSGLDQSNFQEYLEERDLCFVFFYKNRKDLETIWARDQFKVAARTVEDSINHTFATVNCRKEKELCRNESKATRGPKANPPFFRLYSRGATVGTIQNVLNTDADTLKTYISLSPIFQKAVPQRPPCAKS